MRTINHKIALYLFILLIGYGCKEPDYIESTSDDTLIGEFLEQNDDFSEFVKVLNITGNLSFLKAYGTYTCFAPTNDALSEYASEKGVSAIEDVDINELNDLVKYHIILDTISSVNFSDGKLQTPNMYGQYLLVNSIYDGGEAKTVINKYAELVSIDNQNSNGVVHGTSSVVKPITESIAELIEEDEQYSIFTEALKNTGYYDTLLQVQDPEVENKDWYTVFAQTNASYEKIGINSYDDLKNKYCNTGDPSNPEDSFNLYMAYHIVPDELLYTGDLATTQSVLTLAPSEVITISLNDDSVLLNEITFNDELEKGSYVVRDISDNTSANGVFHGIDDDLYIKVRTPFAVYFEVTEQPEIEKMKDIYRILGCKTTLSQDQIEGMSWYSDNNINYVCDNGGTLSSGTIVHGDYFKITLRTAVIQWVEFTTPLLVKGKYKVWMCSRNTNTRKPMYTVTFNDDVLPNIVDDNYTLPKSPRPTDGELLATGYKRYNYTVADSTTYYSDSNGRVVGRLAGTIEVPSTGTHTIRLDVINNEMGGLWLDMIQFIPVDQDQIWPRIKSNGELVYGYPDGYEASN